jgi:serine/threonine protein kinase
MIGRVIHNYRIEELIGEGGMGTVYRAVDTMLGREVALKMLHPKLLQQSTFLDRFKNEAQILAKLNHPNIAILHNFIKDADDYFMVMEYVEGENLENLLKKQGNLAPEAAIPIVKQALEGLSHAHKKGILHRDIKPANLILTKEGTVKLMDFGIAKAIGGQRLTQVNRLVGTLEYLSPEQIQGQEPSPQSDIYAVGVLLFELLTGKLPYQAQTDYDLMQKIISHKPLKISELSANVNKNLENIVSKCLNKKPEQRFTSATGVFEELGKIHSSNTIVIPEKVQTQSIKKTGETPVTFKETVVINNQQSSPKKNQFLIKKEVAILGSAVAIAIGILGWSLLKNDGQTVDDNVKDSTKTEIVNNNSGLNNSNLNELNEVKKEENKVIIPNKEEKEEKNEKKKEDKKPVEKKKIDPQPIETKPVEIKQKEPEKQTIIENKPIENKPIENKPIETKNSAKSITLGSNRITIELLEKVQSNSASEGQSVRLRVVGNVTVDGVTVIRSGATARGVVTAVKKATLLRKETLEIRVKDVEATNGQWIPLKAATFRETSTASEGVSFNSGQTFIVETSYSKINL